MNVVVRITHSEDVVVNGKLIYSKGVYYLQKSGRTQNLQHAQVYSESGAKSAMFHLSYGHNAKAKVEVIPVTLVEQNTN